ncbi:hypothetical protein TWF102_009718 [Orbilia oligospora]|uniref:Tetrapyrrole biosynthesis uroporphyrinogen III synthase domain-containing protein n=1 Tax=Orbilia oligospora TaxID=2813651 RepID=A0A7C8N0D2_ORBOL|nr:hypothetical protein TWF102_009718 [Orbilia oligospora]KAF3101490.1 hypothetical protein TWF103_007908 [Orbilia oligospora]KAF3148609.1 hypothetical protein TWF594_001020 [Orbilia oligospora]
MVPPILLLKTKSTPTDPYATLLSSNGYNPIFVPVLHHTAINADIVRQYILNGAITPNIAADDNNNNTNNSETAKKFAAIIITSQRAVESLSTILDDLNSTNPSTISNFLLQTIIYVVGPATANSLISLGFPPKNILGQSSGNGAVLSDFIVDHYTTHNLSGDLLFLTGETHSTILPTRVPERLRELLEIDVNVEEVVVYKTGVVGEFESDLRQCLDRLEEEDGNMEEEEPVWLIFFSPTGTDAALRVLEARESSSTTTTTTATKKKRRYKCCSIGPTTKDFMFQGFGRKADAMAKIPSPEGVLEAIISPNRVVEELVI